MSADELIDIVRRDGHVLRQASKHTAHHHGWLHKTVIGYVRDGDNWWFVRQAPDRQDGGRLVGPVGGHVQAGESNEDAILRESLEELGARVQYRLVGSAPFRRQVIGRDEHHLFVVYEISTTDEITLNHEAVSYEKLSSTELRQALINTPEEFGDALYVVFEHFYADFLPPDYRYRWKI